MRGLALTTVILFLALTQEPTHQPWEWRGILPFHSTRADVERLLGPPPPPPADGTRIYTLSERRSIYFLEHEEVMIVFVTDVMIERSGCSSLNVDTVASVQVSPNDRPLLSDLRIDEDKFKTFDPSTPPNLGFKAYVDTEDGVYICTQDGRVNEFVYYGNARARQACPALDGDPTQFCNILVDFLPEQDKAKKH
jgi:hypothetical protein